MGSESSRGEVVFCDGSDVEGLYCGHPRVYIRITEEKQLCPYCGKILS
ncbi:zinc-finger domain-containing protein [Anaplasma capra]|nr:zinc-finger domain-containing protein [Anaplasma capra]MCU7611156.1 zinc-finger domain-containing protein [Anaplasma capra]MCU7612340.1 zinc-finger domain-containing protein [Anaplasma capra]